MPIAKTSNMFKAYLILTLTALIWGGNAVAGKLAVAHISPFLLTGLRWSMAFPILLVLALPHLKRDWPSLRTKLPLLIVLGATGYALFNNLMYWALNYTTAIQVGIIQAAMPLMVFAINYVWGKASPTALQIIGFVLTLFGVIITATQGNILAAFTHPYNFGDLLMLIAVFFYGFYSAALVEKPDTHIFSLMATLAFSAWLTSMLFAGYEWWNATLQWPDAQGLGVVLYAATLPSIVAQIFWITGLAIIGSNRGGVFINLVPLFGAGLAVLLLGETFHPYHALSLIMVVGGVILCQRPAKPVR